MMAEADALILADGSRVQRQQTLRSLPGKRDVFAGEWRGQAVIVKVFLDPGRGAIHAQREVDGLTAFADAGIAAPRLLQHGVDRDDHPLIIMQRIVPGESLSTCWQAAGAERRAVLMQRMMGVLAAHHRAGIRQTDLHPGNFLVDDDVIYSLDGAGVRLQPGELDERTSLQNLALLCAQFAPVHDASATAVAADYARQRGWPAEPFTGRLPEQIAAARQWRWEKLRPKLYRECSAIVHDVVDGYEIYARRAGGERLLTLAADPDASLPADPAQWLKDGNTATVWQTLLDGDGVVIKRYNTKSRMHGLKQAAKESRASVSWRNAHMLQLFGIATPEPLALVYGPRRRFSRSAYFIARDVPGSGLPDWLQQHRDDVSAVAAIAATLGRLLAQLRDQGISHGDMKATNFIVHDDEVYVIDLDAMYRHRSRRAFARAWRRDIRRFLANWETDAQLLQVMREAIGGSGS